MRLSDRIYRLNKTGLVRAGRSRRCLTREMTGSAKSGRYFGAMAEKPTVFAAGGIVWRHNTDGNVEFLVVHRPNYDDWSFPKGKRDRGETNVECAVREIREETGFDVTVGQSLPDVSYRDHKGRSKIVYYWMMSLNDPSQGFVANEEVDAVEWMLPLQAQRKLSYPADQILVDHALKLGSLASAVLR